MTERRLLFAVTDDWYFVSHRLALARAAMAAGYRVAVATRVQAHGATITASGCELIPFDWRRRGTSVWHELKTIVTLARLYRAWQPDVIHHVAHRPVVYGSIAARACPKAVVVNAIAGRGFVFTSNSWRARLLRPFLTVGLRAALARDRSAVILQVETDAAIIRKSRAVREGRVAVIRGAGVDPSEFVATDLPHGPLVVLLAARLLWDKGVGEFVEAARLLGKRTPEIRFVLVGDVDPGNYRSISRATVQAWHDAGIVQWQGVRSDMPAVLAQCHIFCLPSYAEGVAKVLLEAASCARAIVTTDVPGCREVVQDGVNGAIVPPCDAVALANAIAALAADRGILAAMGKRGRERVIKEYSIARVAAETLHVYTEAAKPGAIEPHSASSGG
jgi:glycosyltransferase involved in cell wall biosynthesis